MKRSLLGLLLLAACAAPPPRMDHVGFGPWCSVALPSRDLWTIAAEEPGYVLAGGPNRLFRIRLSDGAAEALEVPAPVQDGLAWSLGKTYILRDDVFRVLDGARTLESGPAPPGRIVVAVDPESGGARCATPEGNFVWSTELQAWKPLPPAPSVYSLWRSRRDPSFLVVGTSLGVRVSRDRGRTFVDADLPEGRGHYACGLDFAGGRILFLETNGGKSSLGRVWGRSSIWISSDDGRTYAKGAPEPPTVAIAMAASGSHLAVVGQDGALWVSALTPRD